MNSVFLPSESAGERQLTPLPAEKVLRGGSQCQSSKDTKRKLVLHPVLSTPRLLSLCLVSLSPDFSGVRSYLLRIGNSLMALPLESAHTRTPLLWGTWLISPASYALFAGSSLPLCPLNLLALCSSREPRSSEET